MILPRIPRWLRGTAQSVLAAVLATIVAALATAALGKNPLDVVTTLVTGPFGSPYRFAEAFGRACPLMLCGLAVAIAFRCQAWNIGVEGQYLLGAISATALGIYATNWPGTLLIPAMLVSAIFAGAAFAVVPSLLENRRGVPLVLSTILLNFVARSLVEYLTQGPMRGSDPSAAQSDPIAPQGYIPAMVPQTDLHWGFLLAVAAAIALWFFLRWTPAGFEMRVAGANPVAAEWCGIRVPSVRLRVMCLSGALGGLAGGIQIAGVHRLLNIQASEGFGYVAIAVALLGRLHPLAVGVAAIAIGLLDVGASQLERQPALGIPADVAQIIKGLVILSVLVLGGTRVTQWTNRMLRRRALRTELVPALMAGGKAP